MRSAPSVGRVMAFAVLLASHIDMAEAQQEAPASGAGATRPSTATFELRPARSRVWFDARATMGAFSGRADSVTGRAIVAAGELSGASGEVQIAVASFRTGNGTRDRHLRETLDAEAHPLIVWRHSRFLATPGSARAPALLVGTLTVRGVTRELEVPATVELAGDSLHVTGSVDIRFTDFGIRPPRRILGTIRVADELTLHFDAVFARDRVARE